MSERSDYLKQRYKNGSGNYILMLIVATIFSALGIGLAVIIIKDQAPVGLIFDIPCLGFGFGFGFYAVKTLSLKLRSIRLIDNGKSGTGYFLRLKTVSYKGGRAHQKHCIVFRYTNDSGIEKECTTDYAFFCDEVQGLKSGASLSIKYSYTFAVVVDLIKNFQEASDIAKQGGKEFLNNDRTLGTIEPKINKFLNIIRIPIIMLLVIFLALMITSMVTKINTFIYIGAGLLGAGFVTFGLTLAILLFGNSKK